MYPPLTFLTLVVKLDASDPISLSVNPQPPMYSKSRVLVKYFYFYASDPNLSRV
jgi:hypothetical protein